MGQYWQLYNICRREISPSFRYTGKLGELFFESHGDLESLLTLPAPDDADRIRKLCAGTVNVDPRCRLLKLPAELQAMILGVLGESPFAHDQAALLFLAVTCKSLLAAAEPHIRRGIAQSRFPWVDGRLVCVGDYCHYADMPPDVFTEAEKTTLAPLLDAPRYAEAASYGGLYYLADADPGEFAEGFDESVVQRLWVFQVRARMESEYAPEHWADRERIDRVLEPLYPPREELVVANVSKGEYVRAPAVDALGSRRRSPTLSHVVLARVCYSSDPGTNMGPDGIHQGVWVGDRFRITTVDRLPEPLCGGRWKDVSKEVCAELKEIWQYS